MTSTQHGVPWAYDVGSGIARERPPQVVGAVRIVERIRLTAPDILQDQITVTDRLFVTPGLRYDQMFAAFGCHVEHVEKSSELRPALRRALDSGRVAVVNVVADSESIEASVPWLRLKIGEFYSRGIDDLSDDLISHFRVLSKVEALRLHKSALDNGTRIPMSFMAELCGHPEGELLHLADQSGYRY